MIAVLIRTFRCRSSAASSSDKDVNGIDVAKTLTSSTETDPVTLFQLDPLVRAPRTSVILGCRLEHSLSSTFTSAERRRMRMKLVSAAPLTTCRRLRADLYPRIGCGLALSRPRRRLLRSFILDCCSQFSILRVFAIRAGLSTDPVLVFAWR